MFAGVTTPKLFTPANANQLPPLGFAVIVKADAFVQNSGIGVIIGIKVLVTDTEIVVNDGQAKGFGEEKHTI